LVIVKRFEKTISKSHGYGGLLLKASGGKFWKSTRYFWSTGDVLITDEFSGPYSFLVHIFGPPEIVVFHRVNALPFSVHDG
jgi:hypothetical protein